ncbi:hypothetical protein ACQR5V_21470 [Xanthomonas oryzae pv. oryzicola]|uniref:hypothetical protein n=1 Tax=Xanthomonas oryzae TaxID=347 RepID=UPI0005CF3BED|nr:hypothetical protein [Xanthomonas oryzae]AJQ88064.1 hypothetical protein BE73_14165 [Xanthomonas oryzae pv. oryzicola]AVU02491.1 hypothetical protein C0L90_08525 [Xanthomonas oryzae pv. oryzae]OWB26848.1 hypothetical protein XocBAI21_17465 [Xanthomonas oryzae pv. oryzicola]QBI15691.1 hypothetical protein EYR03_08595 [Xanthomonas oryzae pv. oryzae]QBN38982.1 hypothetical protein EBA04_08575 [Xanthomonas oryzae pv. oryzae]
MDDIEKRARELLAAEYARDGRRTAEEFAALGLSEHRPAINAIIAALSAAPQGLEPAAYQYRDDAAHDAFASSYWEEIPRETYEALKSVMGGHGPKKIAGDTIRGDLRLDPHGWNTELRVLCAMPEPQA